MVLKRDWVFNGLRSMLQSDEVIDISSYPSIQGFHFTRDLGVRSTTLEFGDTGVWTGGWSGNYRWIELFQDKTNLNFVLFNLQSADELMKDPLLTNRASKVKQFYEDFSQADLLIVGRGNATIQKLSLILIFGKDILGKPNKKVKIYHNGDLTLWKTFDISEKFVRDLIKKEVPQLFCRNTPDLICLGNTTQRMNYSINENDISDILLRLAIYTRYLDLFRITLT